MKEVIVAREKKPLPNACQHVLCAKGILWVFLLYFLVEASPVQAQPSEETSELHIQFSEDKSEFQIQPSEDKSKHQIQPSEDESRVQI